VVDHLMLVMPPEAVKILLALLLSFLIGLEREERRPGEQGYLFGGVRTFPLIGLIGLALAQLDATSVWPVTIGFAVISAFLWLSYQHKLQKTEAAGVTTEFSGLATYIVGALVARDKFWVATALAVLSLLLLELKAVLESLSRTHRLLIVHEAVEAFGVGAEIAARMADIGFDELDAPILRVGAPFMPSPVAKALERRYMPNHDKILAAARRLLA